jgi:hypothetical protein
MNSEEKLIIDLDFKISAKANNKAQAFSVMLPKETKEMPALRESSECISSEYKRIVCATNIVTKKKLPSRFPCTNSLDQTNSNST